MAILDSRGFVDDGSSNLTVAGTTSTAATVMTTNTLAGSGSLVTIPAPGFYAVPCTGTAGQGTFTGSLPAASAWPGAELLLTDTLGIYPWMLTGTISMPGTGSVANALTSMSSSLGTKLFVSQGGTVGLWSDSKGWMVSAVSGTVSLRP